MDKMTTSQTPYSTSYEPPKEIIHSLIAPIAVMGTIANVLSLTYFVEKIRWSQTRRCRDTTKTTILLASLNVSDLLLCLSAMIYFITFSIPSIHGMAIGVSQAAFSSFLLFTSFLTCLLATVRAIHLAFPFHAIKWGLVKVSMAIYALIVLALVSLRFNYIPFPSKSNATVMSVVLFGRFIIAATLFLVILISNVVSLRMLFYLRSKKKKSNQAKREITITVWIISILYSVCNIGLITMACIPLISEQVYYYDIPLEVTDTFVYIMPALNSACNPLIYFSRNVGMRTHLKRLWKRSYKFRSSFMSHEGSRRGEGDFAMTPLTPRRTGSKPKLVRNLTGENVTKTQDEK